MYTQCSNCETVFSLSADVLRAAGGQVRCGNCGEVFNALARLAEDSTGFATGESQLDLETRADSILESVSVPRVAQSAADDIEEFGPPGVEIAHLEVLDWPEDDVEQEPPQTLDRQIDSTGGGTSGRTGDASGDSDASGDAGGAGGAGGGAEIGGAVGASGGPDAASGVTGSAIGGALSAHGVELLTESLEFTLPPGDLDRIFAPQSPSLQPSPTTPHTAAPGSAAAPAPAAAAAEPAPRPDRRARFEIPEVSDDVRRDILAGIETGAEPAIILRRSPPRSAAERVRLALWAAAAIGAAGLLALQIGRNHREWFGAPPAAPANLDSYQLRGWGVTGDPDAHGTLRVRASILNTAAQLRPYPLLRVTLADRFGKRIGVRDFEPSEYVGKPTAPLLAPGEQVDATLRILDPGKNAEGFEIDVCMRGADQHVVCTADPAAHTQQ